MNLPQIPSVIKRNTVFLAVSRALLGSTTQLIPSLAGLIMLRFTDSVAFVGFISAIVGISRIFASYPSGQMADAKGRRLVLILGLLLNLSAFFLIYFSVVEGWFWIFILSLVLFGVGWGALNQMEAAAMDMYPVSRKAEGLSYTMMGGVFGSVGAPLIVFFSTNYAESANLDPFAVPWLVAQALMVVSILLISRVQPDPLDIGKSLEKFYPKMYISNETKTLPRKHQTTQVFTILKYVPVLAAIISLALAWGNMSLMMAFVSVALKENNYALTLISISVAIHVFGMFGLTLPLGKLSDKYGRSKLLVAGSILLGLGALIVPNTDYLVITLGIFLVGLGWSAVKVTATAFIGDIAPSHVLGRLTGFTQIVGGAFSVAVPVIGGLIAQTYGFESLGILGLFLALLILPAAIFLREKKMSYF